MKNDNNEMKWWIVMKWRKIMIMKMWNEVVMKWNEWRRNENEIIMKIEMKMKWRKWWIMKINNENNNDNNNNEKCQNNNVINNQ